MIWSKVLQKHVWQDSLTLEILTVLRHHLRHWQFYFGISVPGGKRIGFSVRSSTRTRSVTRKASQAGFQNENMCSFRRWGTWRFMWFSSVELEALNLLTAVLQISLDPMKIFAVKPDWGKKEVSNRLQVQERMTHPRFTQDQRGNLWIFNKCGKAMPTKEFAPATPL